MNEYEIKGAAITCIIKAASREEAAEIFFSPLIKAAAGLQRVTFQKNG